MTFFPMSSRCLLGCISFSAAHSLLEIDVTFQVRIGMENSLEKQGKYAPPFSITSFLSR
jgi:hypothetical protein